MTIINKGIFDTADVFLRQTGNDWPTAQVTTTSDITEGSNLNLTGGLTANTVTANSFISTGTGVPTLSSATNINLAANGINGGAVVVQSSALRLNPVTQAIRDTFTPSTGDLIYNSNTATVQVYGTAWKDVLLSGANITVAGITANIWNGLYTANVIESASNLYFTNARVYSNVIALLPSLAGQNITIAANGQINSTASGTGTVSLAGLTTSNLAEGINLYYTNARVFAAVSGNLISKVNVSDLTTANVSELTNLYYTNARVISAVLSYLTTSNVSEGSNLYYTNARVLSALTGNITIGNLVTGTSVSNSYVTTGNVTAGNVIATTLVLGSAIGGSITGANLLSANNIQSNIWLGLYTANVIESSSALYYTNARVNSNVIAFLPSLAGSGIQIQANGQINASAQSTSLATLAPFLTTSNVSEGSNLYYTNARVLSALTGNVITGNIIANTLLLGSASGGSVTGANLLSANNIQGTNWLGLYTSNVIESSSALYYTNARVYSNVIALLPTLAGSGIQIQANGQINTNASATSGFATSSNVANTVLSLSNFTTANLVEGTNLYYTNARVASNVIGLLPSLAGQNVSILANGQISANIVGITVAATQTISILAATTTYTMTRSVANPESIFVINEGLIQIPTTDYTVSGTTLTTTTQYPVGSNLEIRYLGTTSSISTTTVIGGVNPISFMLSGL